jgi:LuxR family transcriptional regulator, maltose regulon positive regulatory protein
LAQKERSRLLARTVPDPVVRPPRRPRRSTIRHEPIIRTKLSPPPDPKPLVERTRLHALLDAGIEGPMTLVSGPAGAGKTTLLASWMASHPPGMSVAWVTMEAQDREAQRFWTHLLASIRETVGSRAGPLAKLAPPRTVGDDRFLPRFIDAVSTLPRPLVLIIDDAQETGSREVERIIERLVWLAPDSLRLVLSTRRDPRMPLARLRAGGKMAEIRGDDLAFSVGEARDLLRGFGLRLDAREVELLRSRTEGWAVALRLAAVSLRRCADPNAFLREFSGSDQAITDYLVEELLSHMSPDLQRFLLRTSIADRLMLDLAEELAGTDAQSHLGWLERESALIVSLGDGWFRYNRLLTELLRARLALELPGEAPALHTIASSWLAARGLSREALQHALAARSASLAAEILSDMEIWPLLGPGGAAMREVIDQIPSAELADHPDAYVAVAASRVADGDTAGALALLRSWQRSSRAPHAPHQRIRAAIVGLTASRRNGDVGATLRWSRRAVRQGDVDISDVEADRLRAILLEHRGWAMLWSGAREQAQRDLREAHRAARWIGDDALHLSVHSLLAACELRFGHISAATDLANEALVFAGRHGMTAAPEAALVYFVLAAAHGKRGEMDALEAMLRSGRAAARAGVVRDTPLWAMETRIRARLDLWEENPEVGANLLSATRRRLEGDPELAELAWTLALDEADLCLRAGRPEAAQQLLAGANGRGESVRAALVRAKIAAWHGDVGAAAMLLEGALDATLEENRPADASAWLQLAVLCWERRNPAGAWEAMERALRLSEPDGIAFPFLMEDRCAEVLWNHIARGTGYEQWALTLLDRIESRRPAAAGAAPTERLSMRERTVLQYMDTLMSVNEISRELYVSTNTIKTHIKHIYRKLGVSRRRDAVERARALHLLDGHASAPVALIQTQPAPAAPTPG